MSCNIFQILNSLNSRMVGWRNSRKGMASAASARMEKVGPQILPLFKKPCPSCELSRTISFFVISTTWMRLACSTQWHPIRLLRLDKWKALRNTKRITISLAFNADGSDKLPLFSSAMPTSPDVLARRLVGSLDIIIAATRRPG